MCVCSFLFMLYESLIVFVSQLVHIVHFSLIGLLDTVCMFMLYESLIVFVSQLVHIVQICTF